MALDTAEPDRPYANAPLRPNPPDLDPAPVDTSGLGVVAQIAATGGRGYGAPVPGDWTSGDDITLPFIPPSMTKEQAEKLRKTNIQILEDEIGVRRAEQINLDQRDKELENQMARANAAIGHEGSHLQPWNADREMAARKHDLWEQFGSPGFIVAMIGSAFTAMPMVSALNGGAAAMNAINQGDIDGYDKAFQAWQENTKLTINRMKMEQDQFSNLESLRKDNMGRWKEELALKLDQFGDRRKKALLEAGYDDEVIKAYEAQEKLIGQLETNYQAHIENKALFDALQKDPDWTNGNDRLGAYSRGLEKITRAKNAGKWGGSDGELWAKVEALYPNDIDAQTRAFANLKREMKGETVAARAGKDAEEIEADIKAEHPDWTRAQTIEERNRRVAASKAHPQQTTRAVLEDRDKAEIRAAILEKEPDIARDELVKRVDQEYARITAKQSGTPQAKIMDKFWEENPHATAAQAMAFQSLSKSARSAQAQAVSKFLADNPEASPDDIIRFGATFNRAMAKARQIGSREANVDAAVVEAQKAANLALSSSDAVTRTDFTPINEILQKIRRGESIPEQATFDVANASLITAYAQTMSRTGANTVTAQNRAAEILSTATGPKGYRAAVNTLLMEMKIVQDAVNEVAAEITGKPGTAKPSDQPAPPVIKYDSTGKRIP